MPNTPPPEACPKGYVCKLAGSDTDCESMPPNEHPIALAEMVCVNSLLGIMGNPNRVILHDRRMVLGWDLAELGMTLRGRDASHQAFAESKAVFHGIVTEIDRPLAELLRAQHALDSLRLLRQRRQNREIQPNVMAAAYRRFGRTISTILPHIAHPKTDNLRDDFDGELLGLLAEAAVEGLFIRTLDPKETIYVATLREDGGGRRYARFNHDCYQIGADGYKIPIQIKFSNGGDHPDYHGIVVQISLVDICRQMKTEVAGIRMTSIRLARLIAKETQGDRPITKYEATVLNLATDTVKRIVKEHTEKYLASLHRRRLA